MFLLKIEIRWEHILFWKSWLPSHRWLDEDKQIRLTLLLTLIPPLGFTTACQQGLIPAERRIKEERSLRPILQLLDFILSPTPPSKYVTTLTPTHFTNRSLDLGWGHPQSMFHLEPEPGLSSTRNWPSVNYPHQNFVHNTFPPVLSPDA